MTHWSRRARWIVAVAGVTFAVTVFVGLRHRQRSAPASPITPSDPRAQAEIRGATSRQWSGANENFTVTAEEQLLYADGGVKLKGVTVYVDDREGNRKFVATGREAEAGPKQDYVNLRGDVTMVSSDGLKIEAPEASYSTGERIIRAPGLVTFSRGRMTGQGTGMTYDRNNDVLWLQEQATVAVAPDANGAGKVEVTSGTANLARMDKYLRFERDVRILRDNRRIQADIAVGYLSDDESHITGLDLRGNSRIETDSAAPGAVRDMTARDITMTYSQDGERVERAVLAGGASIRIAGEGRTPERSIASESLDVGLNSDGTTVSSLSGREGVQLEFPAEGVAPARSVRAAMLDSASNDKRQLTGARLTDNVEYREGAGTPPGHPSAAAAPGTPPVPRIVRARVLDLTFTPGMGGITDARFSEAVRFDEGDLHATATAAHYEVDGGIVEFSGAVRFDEGDLHATAATAHYEVDRGVVELLGDMNTTPTVTDARITVDARRILLTVEGPKVMATEAVRSVLRPDKKDASGAKAPQKLPGFLTDDQPINVTADALDYDGPVSRAVYDGNARLWQGESAVQGDSIKIDTKAGNLKATGSVRSTWFVGQAGDTTKETKKVPTVASAQDLDYDDQTRRATYTTDAHVNGPQGDLIARRIEMYLAKGDNQLERVEGYEGVTVREAGRSATGDRLSYFSADGRYDMQGTPVRIVEDCRDSTGRTLTFYKSSDRILVDGQQVSRTRSKSGRECSAPPR
jgi:LPS export ABC transporter protein LptC/lipopolysaccharide transport protein LptA